MNLGSIVFMSLTWLIVIGLNLYCFAKLFSKPGK